MFHQALNLTSITQFLNHCSKTKNISSIQKLHGHLITSGLFFIFPKLQNQLLFTYTKCLLNNNNTNTSFKTLASFTKCLDRNNPIPFNSIISQFSQTGFDSHALYTFSFMHSTCVYIDSFALCSSVKSASCLKDSNSGRVLHGHVHKSGWLASVFVGSALVDFYAKLLCMDDADKVFDEIPVRNTVCVNALLTGYAEAKMWVRVFELLRRMPVLGLTVDGFTLSAALRACIGLCALDLAKPIHGCFLRNVIEFGPDVYLETLLIEMYGKFGLLENAKRVFDLVEMRHKDLILWTSMLGAYGKNGSYEQVILLFEDMLMKGIRPDGVPYLTVISACSHTGQVDLGMRYFESMTRYGVIAGQEHYSSLVDLLCRAGELERAWKLVSDIQHNGDEVSSVSMWGTLLSACNECGNVNLGKLAAERALELEPCNVGIYVLLSNMYARNGMWDEIEEVREVMRRRGLEKENGWSLVGQSS